ncbi:MAG TPA: hypothetical protein PK595_05320 [Bacteroidota bacterium]|jgi:hypothetical protein|nr:hypothetical protein [Bacteroidota bacterium]
MAKVNKNHLSNKTTQNVLPFTKENYIILLIGLVVITLGYIALSQSPWDGTLPLVVAPILLVLGYCVIIPIGIIYRKKDPTQKASPSVENQTR